MSGRGAIGSGRARLGVIKSCVDSGGKEKYRFGHDLAVDLWERVCCAQPLAALVEQRVVKHCAELALRRVHVRVTCLFEDG